MVELKCMNFHCVVVFHNTLTTISYNIHIRCLSFSLSRFLSPFRFKKCSNTKQASKNVRSTKARFLYFSLTICLYRLFYFILFYSVLLLLLFLPLSSTCCVCIATVVYSHSHFRMNSEGLSHFQTKKQKKI